MCYRPTVINKYNHITGKWNELSVPCRKCGECRQQRANEWGLRCHMELKKHQDKCFLTLTYAEEYNPIVLHKAEFQKFIKRLRKKAKVKIKYFGCGEYGDRKLRPHFHITIFGYDFQDKRFWKMSPSKIPIYISEELKKLWKYGDSYIQPVSIQSVKYASLYATKEKESLPEPLNMFPEFNLMSQNLGVEEILKKMDTYLLTDEIYVDGHKYIIPDIVLDKWSRVSYNGKYFKAFKGSDYEYYIRHPERAKIVEELKHRRQTKKRERDLVTAERVAKKRKKFAGLREI